MTNNSTRAVLAVVGIALHVGTLQAQPTPHSGLRLSLVGSLGRATGAGNAFTDLGLTAGVQRGRLEFRARLGTLASLFFGCDQIVPTKCGAGGEMYYDATASLRLGPHPYGVGAWTITAGPGIVRNGNLGYIGVAIGRDQPIGRNAFVRIEAHGRHLFDDAYRTTWKQTHSQFGLRLGVGLATL